MEKHLFRKFIKSQKEQQESLAFSLFPSSSKLCFIKITLGALIQVGVVKKLGSLSSPGSYSTTMVLLERVRPLTFLISPSSVLQKLYSGQTQERLGLFSQLAFSSPIQPQLMVKVLTQGRHGLLLLSQLACRTGVYARRSKQKTIPAPVNIKRFHSWRSGPLSLFPPFPQGERQALKMKNSLALPARMHITYNRSWRIPFLRAL